MQIPERKFLPVIDSIHRAGLDPNAWQDVVDHLHELLPMACVALHGYQMGTPPVNITVDAGWDPRLIDEFRTHWAARNPYPALIPQMVVGVPVVAHASRFIEIVRKTDFYQDWLLKEDYGAAVGIPLWSTPQRVCFLAFDYSTRRAAKIDQPATHIAATIAPHVARSFEVSHRIASLHYGPAQLASLLGRISGPALIVDHSRRVRLANAAGETMLRSGATLKIDREGGVALVDPSAEASLAQLLRACFDPDFAATPCAVSFTTADGAACWLNVVPLVADDSVGKGLLCRFLADPERLALLIVSTDWAANADAAARLREAFNLTATEVKLALALMHGRSLDGYARDRGITLNTARNQLRSMFEKCNTHRQAELVALLFSELRRSMSL